MNFENKPRLFHLVDNHINSTYDRQAFRDYLNKSFTSIAFVSKDTNTKIICPMIVFHKIMQLPFIISSHLHRALTYDKPGLNEIDFINGLDKFYNGTFEEKLTIIFSMCDCNHNRRIIQDDMILMLKHLHYFHDSQVKGTIGSFDIVRKIIGKVFNKKSDLTIEELKIELSLNSDLLILFVIFFVHYKPFHQDNVAFFQTRKSIHNEQIDHSFNSQLLSLNDIILGECSDELFIYLNNRFDDKYQYVELLRKMSSSSIDELDKFEEDIRDLITDSSFQGAIGYDNNNNNTLNESMICNHRSSFRINHCESIIKQSKWSTHSLITVSPSPIISKNYHSPSKFNSKNPETAIEPDYSLLNPLTINISTTTTTHRLIIEVISKMRGTSEKMYLSLMNRDLFVTQQEKVIEIINMNNYFISCEISDCFSKRNISSIVLTPYYGIYLPIKTFICKDFNQMEEFVKNAEKNLKQRIIKNEYELIEEIWKGDYSYIFKGCSINKPNDIVAVKILNKRNIDCDHLEMIETEVEIYRLLQKCQHKNIIKSIDLFESANNYYIINEYIPDGTLENYLNIKTHIKMEEFKGLIKQIIKSIHFIHSFGIIHRDLKAANILIVKSKDKHQIILKLNDFGLSKIIYFSEKANEPCGSLCYTAPEIILLKPYNHKVDIWSLGILAYYMWYHQFPFYDEEDLDVITEKIIQCNVIFPSNTKAYSIATLNDSQQQDHSNIQHFITLCLTHEPEKRVNIGDILNI